MKKRLLTLALFTTATLSLATPQAEYCGNNSGPFKKALAEVAAETTTHRDLTLPSQETQLLIWSQLGKLSAPQPAENIAALQQFVREGGVFILTHATPTQAFAGSNAFDLTPGAELLGARSYRYGSWEAAFQNDAAKLLAAPDELPQLFEERGAGLGNFCGMQVLIGDAENASLGINRIGDGAVIYTRLAPTDPALATAVAHLVKIVLDPAQRNTLLPPPSGNEAVAVAGRRLHLALAFDNEKSPLDELLPRLLGKRAYHPLPGIPSLTVHVGRTPFVENLGLDFETLHPYGYHIVLHQGKDLLLAGKHSRGTQYAVIDFLKRYLGYRRFDGVSELYEIVPQHELLQLPQNLQLREEPSIHSYNLAAPGSAIGLFGRTSRVTCQATHALNRLVPPEKYGKSHPHFFPMINGKRTVVPEDGKMRGPWNPCVTSLDMPHLMQEYATSYFTKQPENIGLPLGVNDGGGDCQCDGCRAVLQTTGNQYVHFYNEAARLLAKSHPDKLASFIAYSYAASEAPRGVQLEPNILVEITGMSRSAFARFPEWHAAGARHFGLYDYLYPFGGCFVTPRHYPRIMARLWRETAAKYGIESMWLEYFAASAIFDAGRQYVLNELAWNLDADIEALLDDYYQNLYAEAAIPVKRFFDIHEEVYGRKADYSTPIADRYKFSQMDVYTRDDLKRLEIEMKLAQSMVKEPLAARRLELLAKMWHFSQLRIEGNILTREVQALGQIKSQQEAEKLLDLIERGYANVAASAAFSLTAEEERLIFNNPEKHGFEQTKNISRLDPLVNFEKESDPALERLTAWLETSGADVIAFYQQAAAASKLEQARAALLTQTYIRQQPLENLVRNPSFEELKGEPTEPLLSDHLPFEGVPGWSVWRFPRSTVDFFINREVAHSGKHSGAIGEMQHKGSLISYVKLEPNCRYRLSFYVRRNCGDDGFGMGSASIRMRGDGQWLDRGSAIAVAFPPECQDNWMECKVNFTAPDREATALILLSAPRQAPGVWTAFDDVSLVKIYDPALK